MPAPGTQGVTLTSSFEPFKGEMTLEEVLNKICEDKRWGWYVNIGQTGGSERRSHLPDRKPKGARL